MKTPIDYAMNELTELFAQLVKNVDGMSEEDYRIKKQEISDTAHDLFRLEIFQAFEAGKQAEEHDTGNDYFDQSFPHLNWP